MAAVEDFEVPCSARNDRAGRKAGRRGGGGDGEPTERSALSVVNLGRSGRRDETLSNMAHLDYGLVHLTMTGFIIQ